MEHLTQIRTDEFSMRDLKVHQLEEEIKRSKEINSQLMVDNFIMKTKLDGVSSYNERNKELETFLRSPDTTIVGKFNTFEKNEQEKSICKFDNNRSSKQTTSIEDKLNEYLSRKNAVLKKSVQNVEKNKSQINSRIDNFKESEEVKIKKQSSTTAPTTSPSTTANSKIEFCWRCLRNGHSGPKCKENKTVLGRDICRLCNKAGHKDESCGENNNNINPN